MGLDHWWKWVEKQPKVAGGLVAVWLAIVNLVAFIWYLGSTGLVDETEPLFAEASRQMLVTGDWVTPYWNGETRFDKPALVYWFMAICYKLVGVNAWGVRLPSALSAIALVYFGYYTLSYFGFPSPQVVTELRRSGVKSSQAQRQLLLSAIIGATFMAINPQTISWARVGVSDMLLSACIGGALFSFFIAYGSKDLPESASLNLVADRFSFGEAAPTPNFTSNSELAPELAPKLNLESNSLSSPTLDSELPLPGFNAEFWYLAFYGFMGLAVLTKGPIGLVLPGLTVLAFTLYLGNCWQIFWESKPIRGLGLVTAINAPWYILVTLANGQNYIDSFFGYHNVERFTAVVNRHSAPIYFYLIVVLIGFFPASVYLPQAIARIRVHQRSRWQDSPRCSQLGLFALFWFATVFIFFTIAVTKLPSYVLPLMPAAAILVALLWSDQERDYPLTKRVLTWSTVANMGVYGAIAAVSYWGTYWIGFDPMAPQLPQAIRDTGLPVISAIFWLGCAGVLGWCLWQHQERWAWIVNGVAMVLAILIIMTPAALVYDQQRQAPLRELSAVAQAQAQPKEELIMIGDTKPSVVFYAQKPVVYLWAAQQVLPHLSSTMRIELGRTSAMILAMRDQLQKTGLKARNWEVLGRSGPYRLVRVTIETMQN